MRIAGVSEMVALEARAIAAGAGEDALMEQAAAGMVRVIHQQYPHLHRACVLVGKGHNGGDGLVVARLLAAAGWEVSVHGFGAWEDCRELPQRKLEELRAAFPEMPVTEDGADIAWPGADGLLIDAILGVGTSGPLKGAYRELVETVNALRDQLFFRTVALDGPTGLLAEVPAAGERCAVRADLTITVGYCKEPLIREPLSGWVGRLEVVPLFAEEPSTEEEVLVGHELAPLLPYRSALSHKNNFGRAVIIGGSEGFLGAPVMAAEAALRSGCGLLNLAVPHALMQTVAAMAPHEAMLVARWPGGRLAALLESAAAVAIGPGMGTTREPEAMLRWLLGASTAPIVVDADALTCLSRHLELLREAKAPVVLTPHPGEMSRLLGDAPVDPERRAEIARDFAEEHRVILVLKGTRTVVAAPGRPVCFNTTGNSGLSTGGSGDTLTGIITALLAQKLTAWDAARLGVWLHGHAADLALQRLGSEEALLPRDVTAALGPAIAGLRLKAQEALF
ncbi:MAG: NAD(P)H-hydrate dehydratase [Verrucomicrobiota bacterium]